MAVAAWIVGAILILLWLGTWALQAAIWLLVAALRIVGRLARLVFGALPPAAPSARERRS